jgi:hypothetical protein
MACERDHQLPSLAEKLLAVGKPRFNLFEERRRGGVPPPEMESASDTLAIPADIKDLSNIKLLSKDNVAAPCTRRAEDVFMGRIPEWAGDDATSCIFPRQVQDNWPKTEFKPIDSSEASCLRVTDVRGKGKGCVAARTVPRGELVARERALLIIPRTFMTPQQVAGGLAKLMSPKQLVSFSALYNCKSAEPHDALGIISTNSFLLPGMPGHDAPYSAVFETFARINHRCGFFSLRCHGDNELTAR